MAVIKNVTKGALTLGVSGAPVYSGDEVTLRDERMVGRAWPKSTWEVVEPPKGFEDTGPADAYVFTLPELETEPGDELPDLPEGAYAPDAEEIES